MYILLLRHCFFSLDATGNSRQKRTSAVSCRFRSIEENCQIFLRFPSFENANQSVKLFLLPCVSGATACSTTLTCTPQTTTARWRGWFGSLAELFVGKFGRLQQDLGFANDPEPFLLHTHRRAFTHDLPELGEDPCAHLQSPSRLWGRGVFRKGNAI